MDQNDGSDHSCRLLLCVSNLLHFAMVAVVNADDGVGCRRVTLRYDTKPNTVVLCMYARSIVPQGNQDTIIRCNSLTAAVVYLMPTIQRTVVSAPCLSCGKYYCTTRTVEPGFCTSHLASL